MTLNQTLSARASFWPKWLRRSTLKCITVTLCKLSQRVASVIAHFLSCYYNSSAEVLEVNLRWIDEELLRALKSSSDNWLSVFLSLRPSGADSYSNPDSSPQIREHFENACSYYMLLCFQKSTSGAIPQYKTRGWGQEKHTNYSFVLSSCNGRGWVLVTKNSLESKRRRKAGKTYMLDGGWYSRGLLSMKLQLVISDSFSKQLFHRQLNIY